MLCNFENNSKIIRVIKNNFVYIHYMCARVQKRSDERNRVVFFKKVVKKSGFIVSRYLPSISENAALNFECAPKNSSHVQTGHSMQYFVQKLQGAIEVNLNPTWCHGDNVAFWIVRAPSFHERQAYNAKAT